MELYVGVITQSNWQQGHQNPAAQGGWNQSAYSFVSSSRKDVENWLTSRLTNSTYINYNYRGLIGTIESELRAPAAV